MNKNEFENLQSGDLVIHKTGIHAIVLKHTRISQIMCYRLGYDSFYVYFEMPEFLTKLN